MKIKRLLIVFTAIFFLQSCGFKFWYNRLDWVVTWQLDNFVELSDEQEESLEATIRQKLQWHRTTQLPRYVSLTNELKADLGTENIDKKYDYYQDNFYDFYRTVLEELAPELIAHASQLTDEQTQELIKNLNDDAAKQQRKFKKGSTEKRIERLQENIEDSFKNWAGKLTKEQTKIISQWIDEIQPTAELRFEYGNQWRSKFERALTERRTEQGQQSLSQLILESNSLRSPELTSRIKINRETEKRFILALHKTMTTKQKKRFLKELENYREDFQDLIED